MAFKIGKSIPPQERIEQPAPKHGNVWFAPAVCCQVDFGEVPVKAKNGAEEKLSELIVSFPFSNAEFAQICHDETKESLCAALQRIFEFIGGVPLRILFDNMVGITSLPLGVDRSEKTICVSGLLMFTLHEVRKITKKEGQDSKRKKICTMRENQKH